MLHGFASGIDVMCDVKYMRDIRGEVQSESQFCEKKRMHWHRGYQRVGINLTRSERTKDANNVHSTLKELTSIRKESDVY